MENIFIIKGFSETGHLFVGLLYKYSAYIHFSVQSKPLVGMVTFSLTINF